MWQNKAVFAGVGVRGSIWRDAIEKREECQSSRSGISHHISPWKRGNLSPLTDHSGPKDKADLVWRYMKEGMFPMPLIQAPHFSFQS